MLGYAFQELYALWTILKLDENFEISIEKFDDFSIDEKGMPKTVVQTKQHGGVSKLGDTSQDLWKTIANWSEDYFIGILNPNDTKLVLVTTSKCDTNSIASKLRLNDRNTIEARRKLDEIAESSMPSSNQKFYSKYTKLDSYYKRKVLVENIVIIDGEPILTDILENIRNKLTGYVEERYMDLLLDKLVGWWRKRVIEHLTNDDSRRPIRRNEVHAQIREIIRECANDALPIFSFDESEAEKISEEANFLKQLTIIDERPAMKNAKRNYFLAQKHRSAWIRYDSLYEPVIDKFIKNLTDEWDEHYQRMIQNIKKTTSENIRKRKGKELFDWANNKAEHLYIKPNTRHAFIRRGFFHILANGLVVGWHPDFKTHLS